MHILQLFLAEPQRWRRDSKAFLLLDVRTDEETAVCTPPDSVHIPMNLVPLCSNELPDGLPIVTYCHHGVRNPYAAMYLTNAGFETLYNLQDGIDAWTTQIDENMTRYQRT